MMTHEEMTLFLQARFGLSKDNADSLAYCLDVLKEAPPDEKSSFDLEYKNEGEYYSSIVFALGTKVIE